MPPTVNDPNEAGRAAAAGAMLLDAAPLANPFVGLRPFDSAEALLFFGRDEQTTELMQQLHRTRFLAVVGSSGCGKSSLIRAGLIPKLKGGFLLADRGDWRVAAMKPGKAPLQNLAAALLAAFDEDPAGGGLRPLVEEIEAAGAEAVVEYLSRRPEGKAANFLLLVDQFEEIFRFGAFTDEGPEEDPNEDPDERERRRAEAADFVSIMLALTRGGAVPVYVVMTMRSDFLGDCDAFHGLPQAMNRSQYLVPRLTRQQRLEAIQCPVRLCRKTISPELVVRVLDDMGEDSDQLPVMQHALMRTFDKSQEDAESPRVGAKPGGYDVRLEHYEAVGTLKGALSKDADEALAGMTPEELTVTQRMFQALVETDAKERRVRRPVHMSEVEAITGAGRRQIERIIARFRDNNRSFLTLSEDRLHGDPLIDISHESLIRQWETLKGWAKEEVESKDLYLRLASDAVRYCHRQAPLWIDPALQLALDWWEKRRPNRAWANRYHPRFALAQGFLRRSRLKREADLAETERRRDEQLTAEREQRERAELYARQQEIAARRLRRLTGALAVFVLLMMFTAFTAVYAMRKSWESEKRAVSSANEARKANERLRVLAKDFEAGEAVQRKLKDDAIAREGEAERLKKAAEKNAAEARRAQEREMEAKNDLAGALTRETTAKNDLQQTLDTLRGEKLRREANKAQEANKVSEALQNYVAAIAQYDAARDYDGAAFTRVELGRMLLSQPISESQKMGLGAYHQAIDIYRRHQDFSAAAVTFRKISDFYFPGTGQGGLDDDEAEKPLLSDMPAAERTKLAVQGLCEALGDYEKAKDSSPEGRIVVLAKLGNILEGAEGSDEEASEEDAPASPAEATGVAGCAGRGTRAVDYFAQMVPIIEESISRRSSNKELADSWRETLVTTLIRVSKIQLGQGAVASAHASLDKAAGVYKGNPEKEVETLLEIAGAAGDLPTKDKYYRRAADAAGGNPETLEKIGNSLYLFGRAELARSRPGSQEPLRKSIEYYEEARRAHAAKGNNEFQARALNGVARSYVALRELDAGLAKYEEAVRLLPAVVKDISPLAARQLGDAHYAIGNIQLQKKQTLQARESYQKARTAYETAKYDRGRLNVSRALAALGSADAEDSSPAAEPEASARPAPPARAAKVDIEAKLTGGLIGGRAPEGQANFEVKRNGDSEFTVKVEDVELDAGAVLGIFIDGRQVGMFTLRSGGEGRLKLESSEGQVVPVVGPNAKVVVKDAAGRTIVAGSFPGAPPPTPSPTPTPQ